MSQNDERQVTRTELQREVEVLRQLIQAILAEREKALELQRLEYHRRLDELNQAHARAEKAAAATVPREVYDLFERQVNEWKDMVNKEINTTKTSSIASAKFFALMVTVVTLLFSAIAIWIAATHK